MKRVKPPVRFSRLSSAQKRVAIAEDVIAQIKAGKFTIQSGTWAEAEITMPDTCKVEELMVDQNILLQGLPLVQPQLKCSCCAVGAAFLSSIRMANVATMDGSIDQEKAFDQLKKFFSREQLQSIEQAFELGSGGCGCDDQRAIDFGNKYNSEEKRALAIFGNIVRNNGTFKP